MLFFYITRTTRSDYKEIYVAKPIVSCSYGVSGIWPLKAMLYSKLSYSWIYYMQFLPIMVKNK
jgi:hypothetical protein